MDLWGLREQIDSIDSELMRLFIERMNVSRQIARYKKEYRLPTRDDAREKEKMAIICDKAGKELRPYAYKLYMVLFELSREYQESSNI